MTLRVADLLAFRRSLVVTGHTEFSIVRNLLKSKANISKTKSYAWPDKYRYIVCSRKDHLWITALKRKKNCLGDKPTKSTYNVLATIRAHVIDLIIPQLQIWGKRVVSKNFNLLRGVANADSHSSIHTFVPTWYYLILSKGTTNFCFLLGQPRDFFKK